MSIENTAGLVALWLIALILLQYALMSIKAAPGTSLVVTPPTIRMTNVYRMRNMMMLQLWTFLGALSFFILVSDGRIRGGYEIVISAEILWGVCWYLYWKKPMSKLRSVNNFIISVGLVCGGVIVLISDVLGSYLWFE